MERVGRRERTGASWRDLEHAKVVAQRKEMLTVDFINEDATVGEFLDPSSWNMEAVRLPFDHVPGRQGLLAKVDGEWMTMPWMALDEKEDEA